MKKRFSDATFYTWRMKYLTLGAGHRIWRKRVR
jgi:hypothetical protein